MQLAEGQAQHRGVGAARSLQAAVQLLRYPGHQGITGALSELGQFGFAWRGFTAPAQLQAQQLGIQALSIANSSSSSILSLFR